MRSPDVPGLDWGRASSLMQDRSGVLWFTVDRGVARVREGRVTYLTKQNGLADDATLKLFEDRAGSIWVGTLGGGVTRISGSQLTSWSTRDGLAANHVKSFYEEPSGVLWIGTHGGGLSRFKDGRLATVSMRQGLYNDTVFQILEGGDGNLWMNCNKGVWRTSLEELNAVADGTQAAVSSFSYGVADGMLSSEGVGGTTAGWKMRDGSLWFPTTDGVVVIDPRQRDVQPPRVLIEGVTVDREPLPADRTIRMSPSQQSLEIEYTALNWSRSREVRFKFRMEGLDRDWLDAGHRRTAYYSHLPPGSYTFRVTADNGEGVWDNAGKAVGVVVLPHFYQTWWFQAASGAVAFGVMAVAYRRRITSLRRAAALQAQFARQLIETQESERQRIATELHDGLGQSLLIVKNRAMLGAVNDSTDPESAKEQFDEIAATAGSAIDEVRQIAYDLRPYHLNRLGLVRAVEEMVERLRAASPVTFSTDLVVLDSAVSKDAAIYCYRIIQECLSNIVRHAAASSASIHAYVDEGEVFLTITDDGAGFEIGAAVASKVRPGLGMTGIGERARMLGGSHTMVSRPGAGTLVTIRFPAAAQQ